MRVSAASNTIRFSSRSLRRTGLRVLQCRLAWQLDSIIPQDDSVTPKSVLPREEYIEQEYFFRIYRQRLVENMPSQEILKTIHEEILATTRLPMAIDIMHAEILHSGRIGLAMKRLGHYFTPFQTFVIDRAEDDVSRFEQSVGLEIMEREAKYRSGEWTPQGLFIYQFECLARNRLGYHDGLTAIANDCAYDEHWRKWILSLRSQLGAYELSELIFRASEHYEALRTSSGKASDSAVSDSTASDPTASDPTASDPTASDSTAGDSTAGDSTMQNESEVKRRPVFFGVQDGRIARANIGRDPLYFFAALQRQLSYPEVPLSKKVFDETLPPILEARLVKIEQRLKIVEMEQKGGIDLTKFYKKEDGSVPEDFSK